MLEQHNLEVDTVESAEQALEYLGHHRPDVIFMDHLMPGMDGFQAVQAIKNNPRTATIPIMMYTSQEGDLYVGQARALGAMGVLPKQLKPVDVSKVLYQLNLMPERREAEASQLAEARVPSVVVVADSAVPQGAAQFATGHAKGEPPPRSTAGDLRAQIEPLIREQTTELRRFMIASLDSHANRVVSDLRGAPAEGGVEIIGEEAPPPPPKRTKHNFAVAAGIVAVALAAGLVWVGLKLKSANEQYEALRAQAAQLEQSNRQLTTMIGQLNAAASRRTSGFAPGASNPAAVSNLPPVVLPAQAPSEVPPAPAASMAVETIPYGEVPLAGSRVESVRTLLSQLVTQSFRGTLRVEVFPGRFCLAGNSADGYTMAPDDLAYSKCELVGNPALDNMTAAQRQSLGFENMVAEAEGQSGGTIRVSVVPGSAEHLAVPYPNTAAEGLTAGQWNRAASANNRIEITAVAGS
jgi:CheY-like chemotaxis protein